MAHMISLVQFTATKTVILSPFSAPVFSGVRVPLEPPHINSSAGDRRRRDFSMGCPVNSPAGFLHLTAPTPSFSVPKPAGNRHSVSLDLPKLLALVPALPWKNKPGSSRI